MKIIVITISLLFLPLLLIAQSNTSLDLVIGLGYSYRTLKASSNDPLILGGRQYRRWESPKTNWRIGGNFNVKLSKRIFIKSGIRLASVGYKIKIEDLDVISGGPTPYTELQYKYDFWLLELPVIGRVELSDGKFVPFIEAGVSPSLYLTTRTKEITNLDTTIDFNSNTKSEFTKLHFVGSLSFGVNYNLSNKFQLFGQPIFRYHLTKTRDYPIEEHLYDYGIELGIRRKLK